MTSVDGAPGSLIGVSAPTVSPDTWAASSPPINGIDPGAFARMESCWNALAGTVSIGTEVREPTRPGSATKARAAVSTDPTTNLLGRTRPRPYDLLRACARRSRAVVPSG